jgi:hemolysin activation/secretion protein
MTALTLMAQPVNAEPDIGANDPGAQLERTREQLERQRIAEQIAEDEKNRDAKVKNQDENTSDEQSPSVEFQLQKINFDSSEILTEDELNNISQDYIGKTVTLKSLYEIVEKVNALYQEKGFMTCRAFLPPQTIHAGEVQIRLVEGKTANVTVTGNKHTRESFLKNTFDLKEGEVANTQALNRKLQHFNGTSDAQARLLMKAGKNFGETDYEIILYEPKNQSVMIYVDNAGYENSGQWREGIFYTYRSLTGRRDSFRANYLMSSGTKAWDFGYTMPLGHHGTKLDIGYSANTNETKKGELSTIGVKGKARSISATLRVPFYVTQNSRYETGLQFIRQNSRTDLGTKLNERVHWVDDRITRITPYVSFIHYGDSQFFYHKHSLVFSRRKDINDEKNNATIYKLNSFYQKRFKHAQTFNFRFDAQITSKSLLGSSDRYFIGGVNSVRGYEESFTGGEKGFSGGLEYQIPVT